jgi:hypothetical protein
MFETITYNNLKTLVHDLMTRLYDQYHQIWTWRIKIYHKDNKSKYNQLMKVMRTWNVKENINTINSWKSWGQWNIKANINTINSWKSWGHWNIKGNINTINSWKSWGHWNIKGNINTINSWKSWGHWNINSINSWSHEDNEI